MVISLESSVLGGYLTNEVPGLITGVIHLAGQKHPLSLELKGNFLRDIAGCRVDFLNPLPDTDADLIQKLAITQTGNAGVMTASHRAGKLPRRRLSKGGSSAVSEPAGLKNMVFFEWFNPQDQRVLIQSWHLQLRVSAPAWTLSQESETAQLRQSRARRKHFLLNRRKKAAPDEESKEVQKILPDPFSNQDILRDPFASIGSLEVPQTQGAEPVNQAADPVQRSAELAGDLKRFEQLLENCGDVGSRPAVMRLLSTVGDLAVHLSRVLRQFAQGERKQWNFLVVDLEQSLPIFGAGVNACDRIMNEAPRGTDTQWLYTLSRCLLSVELRIRELLMMLRDP
jgi:hypothetical protein